MGNIKNEYVSLSRLAVVLETSIASAALWATDNGFRAERLGPKQRNVSYPVKALQPVVDAYRKSLGKAPVALKAEKPSKAPALDAPPTLTLEALNARLERLERDLGVRA
jgi:hypothetical protein